MSCSQAAISLALELIEPAGATLSRSRQGTATSFSSISSCGAATFSRCLSGSTLVVDRAIPSGAKKRLATQSSQLSPATAA